MYRGDDESVVVAVPLELARRLIREPSVDDAAVRELLALVKERMKRREEEETPREHPGWTARRKK